MLFRCLAFAVMISNTLAASAPCVPCGQTKMKLEKILDAKAKGFRRAAEDVDGSSTSEASPKRARKCCPYDFDSKLCQVINDRVLCGYNKNVGKPESDGTVSLSGGCRLRGGRLECGYEQAPFDGIRRPPAWNGGRYNEVPYEDVLEQYEDEYPNADIKKQKLTKMKVTIKPNQLAVTKCVEVRDRIVCKALDK